MTPIQWDPLSGPFGHLAQSRTPIQGTAAAAAKWKHVNWTWGDKTYILHLIQLHDLEEQNRCSEKEMENALHDTVVANAQR